MVVCVTDGCADHPGLCCPQRDGSYPSREYANGREGQRRPLPNGRAPSPADDRDWTTRRELPPTGRERVNGSYVPPQRVALRPDVAPAGNGRPQDSLAGGSTMHASTALLS